jgi:hypothetical protein
MSQTFTQRDRVKRAVRERDGHRCTECGMTNEEHLPRWGRGLHVHRTVPGSGLGTPAPRKRGARP